MLKLHDFCNRASQATAERQSADARRRLTALDVDQAIARAQADAANAATNAAAASGPALAAAEEAARIARIGYREEIGRHTSELQSLMRISYAVFCLKKKKRKNNNIKLRRGQSKYKKEQRTPLHAN